MSDVEVNNFLEHYGVKGMKWGVRKSRKEGERAQTFGSSKDSKKTDRAIKKARASGIKSLTNQELKDLNQRLQLEQNFSQLLEKQPTTDRGKQFASKFVSEASNIAMNAIRKQAQEQLNKKIAALLASR